MLDYCFSHIPTLVLLALFVATLFASTRTLPAQNVFAVAFLIAAISGLAAAVGVKTGIPFGPFFYTENMGRLFLGILPWPLPLLWVVVILNSRGVVRLLLQPWRQQPYYGYWATGMTCILVVFFDLAALEPFARANHYWLWRISEHVPSWYGAPWINFIAWGAVTLLILGFILPWLINKKSNESQAPPDYRPLLLWLLLMLLLTCANAVHSYWPAAAFSLVGIVSIVVFAWQNSRR